MSVRWRDTDIVFKDTDVVWYDEEFNNIES